MDTRYGQSLDVGKLLSAEDNSVDKKSAVIEETKDDKPASLSKNSVTSWLDKNLGRMMLVFLIILSIVVLIQPKNLDRIDTSVRNSLIAQHEQQAVVDILKEFPDASVQQKRAFAEKKVYEMMQRPEFEQKVNGLAEHYKSFYRDNTGQTLLYSADPYYYFRLARNLVEKGMIGDKKVPYIYNPTIIEDIDVLRNHPFGSVMGPNVFPYVLFYFFRAGNYVIPSVSLLTATFYFPVVAGVISVLLVFLIGQKISGVNAGFFTALVFSLHPIFLFWNYAGYADTHVLAMTVSLAGILLFLYVIDWSNKKMVFLSVIGIVVLLKYGKFVWSGLFFVPVLFISVCAVFAIIWLLRRSIINKKYWFLTGIVIISVMSVWFVYDITAVYRERVLVMLNLAPVNEVFPTAFSVITELEGAKTLNRFVTALGGSIIVLLVLIELLFFVKSLKTKTDIKVLLPFVWLLLFIVPAFLSARFLFFVLPPFVLIAGRSFARLEILVEKLVGSVLKLKFSGDAVKLLSLITVSVLILLIVNPSPFVAKTKLPLVTKSFVDAAEFIRSQSESDAVIATAFDLGYAWQAFSRRATFFDGGLFRTQRDYLMANALMNDKENKSANVFKSMNCRGDIHFVGGGIPQDYGYCNTTNEIFVAITEPMLYQMYLYDYYVKWDFKAAQLRQDVHGRSFDNATAFLQVKYNLSEESAIESYYAAKSFEEVIPPKHVSEIGHCKKNDKMIVCNDGLTVMLSSLNATIEGVYPKSLVFVNDGKRTIIPFKNSKETFSAVVYQSGSEFRSILMDTELTDTLIVRMFTGEQLALFEPVFISGEKPDRVVVYKMKS